jgi:hypothetical protein
MALMQLVDGPAAVAEPEEKPAKKKAKAKAAPKTKAAPKKKKAAAA